MKKKILTGIGLLAVAAMFTLNVNLAKSDSSSTVSLASLTKTAMADCESSTGLPGDWVVTYHSACSWTCTHGGSNTCPL